MQIKNRSGVLLGIAAGASLTFFAAILMGQSANQPARSAPEYFVTGEGPDTHLWVREGVTLRCVGHGECTALSDHDHAEHAHEDIDKHD